MAMSAHQAANDGGNVPTRDGPVAGPDATGQISGLMSQSQSAAESWMAQGRDLIGSPQGSGVQGHDMSIGSMYEWDDGLAISEQPGEM